MACNVITFICAQPTARDQEEPFNIGQQIIVKGKVWTYQDQLFYFQFDNGSITLNRSRVAYGFSDAFGVEVTLPYFIEYKNFNEKSHGPGDVRILGQWNCFRTGEHLGTIRGGIEAPTGSIHRVPATGAGSVSYVADAGFIHSSYKWYAEYFITGFKRTKKNNYQAGSEVRFSTNIGPKIHFNHGKSKLFTLIQLRGLFAKADKISDIKVPNTGSLITVMGPLMSYRYKNIILEGSTEFPISQRFNGVQDHLQWIATLTFQVEF